MLSSTDQSAAVPPPGSPAPTPADVWTRRLLYLRILLITVLLIGILVWLLSFVINPILILIVAALLAYAVVPVIDLLHRVMLRVLAVQ